MNSRAITIATKYVNVGTPMVLMGVLWLYLWVFPWYEAYVYDPRWGHNYAEALAFLAVGLAYFNRRFISDVLALLAATLIIPASLELISHPVTAIAGGVLVALIILDMIVWEDCRGQGLGTWMMQCICDHPAVAPLRQVLWTGDADDFYRKGGFEEMSKLKFMARNCEI